MEKKEVRLSLILPFYGVELYIGQCLESIYRQDIPENEYEVICINDCSPDNTEDVVLKYAKEHENLTLIRHEYNKKLGAARNTGICAAKGKYVWFIDTDDYIRDNCFREILSYCELNDLEILHFGIQDNYGNIFRRLIPTEVVTGPEEELISINQLCIEVTFPWNRVYSRHFLLSNNLYFNDLYGGDVIHTILAVNASNRIKNVDEFYHFYRIDNYCSDTKSKQTAQKIYDMSYVLAHAIDQIVPQIKPIWKFAIEECAPWRINTSIKGVLRLPFSEQRTLLRMLKNEQWLFDYILYKGNRSVNIIFKHQIIRICLSAIYKILLVVKSIIK